MGVVKGLSCKINFLQQSSLLTFLKWHQWLYHSNHMPHSVLLPMFTEVDTRYSFYLYSDQARSWGGGRGGKDPSKFQKLNLCPLKNCNIYNLLAYWIFENGICNFKGLGSVWQTDKGRGTQQLSHMLSAPSRISSQIQALFICNFNFIKQKHILNYIHVKITHIDSVKIKIIKIFLK